MNPLRPEPQRFFNRVLVSDRFTGELIEGVVVGYQQDNPQPYRVKLSGCRMIESNFSAEELQTIF